MSPALKKTFYTVTSAGLLLAAITCSADTNNSNSAVTASTPATVLDNAAPQGVVTQSLAPQSAATTQVNTQLPATQSNVNSYPQNASASTSPKIGSGGHLLNVTLGLMLIIGLIFGLSWFVKRFSQGTFTANSHLKIIATMPLGTRERIVLIDAGGQQLLLGITATHINTLHTFDAPIITNSADTNTSDFGRKLMAILQRPNGPTDESNNNNNSGTRE